ncbi:MAG: type II secretion system protein [Kiritimatiellae bacterium]|nr:type II secretion system protein [Kiritimatiellia bacterium]
MKVRFQNVRDGYTIVEVMATIVIVAVLAATVGTFFVKLLRIQERDREEAYIREKLADVCGAYADAMSVASSFGTRENPLTGETEVRVDYRLETGGVSLETGQVTRVTHLTSEINVTNRTVDLKVFGFEQRELVEKLSRIARGDALLLPLAGDMVRCTIMPLNAVGDTRVDDTGFATADAALGYLQVVARYSVKNDDGELVEKTVEVGRVVRLWNRE